MACCHDGVWKPDTCVANFFLWRHATAARNNKKTPESLTGSGGLAEYPIRDTIHVIVSNLLATKNWWFFVQK